MSSRTRLLLVISLVTIAIFVFRVPGFHSHRGVSSQLAAGVALLIIGITGLRLAKSRRHL